MELLSDEVYELKKAEYEQWALARALKASQGRARYVYNPFGGIMVVLRGFEQQPDAVEDEDAND